MKPFLKVPCIAVLGLLAGAGAARPSPFEADGGPWVSALDRDHPLTGKIWSGTPGEFIDSNRLLEDVAKFDFILLGEKHDNEDHHRIQAWIVTQLFARGRRPALAFEMFTTDQSVALRDYLARRPRDAAGLGPALGWEQRGWPAWRQYQPIAQAALDAGAPVVAADLARTTIERIGKQGIQALGDREVKALALDRPIPEELMRPLRQEIVDAHCGQFPAPMIGPMATVMRARDAHMAGALIDGAARAGRDGAVLITGKGHARRDYGVPYHLERLAPGRSTASIAMLEVAEDITEPLAYVARFNATTLPYDYVWFTPRPERKPACERFAEQLREARERYESERESD